MPELGLRVGLIVPTLNAGARFVDWLDALDAQTLQPRRRWLVDSDSADHTRALAGQRGFEVTRIERQDFDHGGTRQLGIDALHDCKFIVMMTQDALLADADTLRHLIDAFADPRVGAAWGRQLPHPDARPIGAHARLFNYPPINRTVSLDDRVRLGIKTAFLSDSFAAYRTQALKAIGGMSTNIRTNEDTHAAGRLLMAGWQVAYRADAPVYHSHDYSIAQEVRRYFEIGVFHRNQPWLRQTFGGEHAEGYRFLRSELRYLLRRAPWLIPESLLRTGLKYAGYRLGLDEPQLPRWLRRQGNAD